MSDKRYAIINDDVVTVNAEYVGTKNVIVRTSDQEYCIQKSDLFSCEVTALRELVRRVKGRARENERMQTILPWASQPPLEWPQFK